MVTGHTGSSCGYCGATTRDAHLCNACTAALTAALGTIADLWPDLIDAAAKRINRDTGTRGASTTTALLFNPRAAQLRTDTQTHIDRLTALVCHHARIPLPDTTGPGGRAEWLVYRAPTIRQIPAAALYRGALTEAAQDIAVAVDKPNRRVDIPVPCPDCGGPLQAEVRRPRDIRCRACGARHDAASFLAAG